MSELAKQTESSEYKRALLATEPIEAPALGFARPIDYKSTIECQRALVKQNNTVISLILDLSNQVQQLTEQVQDLKRKLITAEKQSYPKELEQSVEELTKKIGSLNLGKDPTVPKKKGSILVFRNPSDILAQERKK